MTDWDVVEKDLSKAGRGGLTEVLELEVTVAEKAAEGPRFKSV